MTPSIVRVVSGRAIAVPGHDIDTDRIMPARFLKAVTFEGLEAHVFEDDRRQAAAAGQVHPFDDPARRSAQVLLAGRNFGCGSSREHAPQALARWGIRAIAAESFAEIFAGNALMIGLPCLRVAGEELARLVAAAAADPAARFTVDLGQMTISTGALCVPASMPDAARDAFLSGAWDVTALLLERYEEVLATRARLPYV